MKLTRIRQLEKLARALQADGYKVSITIKEARNLLVMTIHLSPDNAEEIMAQWNDLRKVEGV